MINLRCRFFERLYPNLDETVKVTVTSIENMGAYVKLLEYNEIEGMIMMSEISRRRIRSINKLIRVGRSEHVVVIRVDSEKGYIDLSKRRVNAEDAASCDDKYNKGKTVNQIIRHTCEILGYTTNEEFEELYNKSAWYFDRKEGKPGSSFDVFKKVVVNPSILKECELDEKCEEVLLDQIRKRLMPQAVKIRTDFDILCFAYEGIEAIKKALHAGLEHSSDSIPLQIHLIAPPSFFMITQTLDRVEGETVLRAALSSIESKICECGGKYNLVSEPRAVSAKEEEEEKKRMELLEKANREQSGDEDSEDEIDSDDEEDESQDEQTVVENSRNADEVEAT